MLDTTSKFRIVAIFVTGGLQATFLTRFPYFTWPKASWLLMLCTTAMLPLVPTALIGDTVRYS
jgi:hypothetical protein